VLLNFMQRKHGERARKKRIATLYLAIAAFAIQIYAGVIIQVGLSDPWLVPGIAVVVGVVAFFHRHTFPFRLRCAVSGERLDFETILYRDSNILPKYDPEEEQDAEDADLEEDTDEDDAEEDTEEAFERDDSEDEESDRDRKSDPDR
jgi:hypothetical protein